MQKNIKSIKGLINGYVLQQHVDLVNISMDVMKYLDDFEGEFNISYSNNGSDMTTTRGIIQKFSGQKELAWSFQKTVEKELQYREMLRFGRDLTDEVIEIVAKCHFLGWKFYLAYKLMPNRIEKEDYVEEVIDAVVGSNLVSYEKAKAYTTELIERHEYRVKKKAEKDKYK